MTEKKEIKFVDPQLDPVVYGPLGPIGHVGEIWGPGGQLCEGFLPTRHELEVLYRYWARCQLTIHIDWFLDDATSSRELRLDPYAGSRQRAIMEALGEAACKELDKLTEADVRRDYGEENWRMFSEQDTKARNQQLERMHQKLTDRDGEQPT